MTTLEERVSRLERQAEKEQTVTELLTVAISMLRGVQERQDTQEKQLEHLSQDVATLNQNVVVLTEKVELIPGMQNQLGELTENVAVLIARTEPSL